MGHLSLISDLVRLLTAVVSFGTHGVATLGGSGHCLLQVSIAAHACVLGDPSVAKIRYADVHRLVLSLVGTSPSGEGALGRDYLP